MKRVLILFVFALSVLGTSAQSVEALFRQYRNEKNVEYVHIPRFVMSMVKMLAKEGQDEAGALKAVSSIRALDMESCSPTVRKNFQKTLQTFQPAGYTPVVFCKEGDETSYIYIKEKKGYIRELLILSAGNNEGAIMQIKGKIKPDDVDTVVKRNTKKNCLKKP